jgi:hypothetical protein
MPTAERQFACDISAFFKTEAGGGARSGKSFSKADKIFISRSGGTRSAEAAVGFCRAGKM